jgi:hypothetical protein
MNLIHMTYLELYIAFRMAHLCKVLSYIADFEIKMLKCPRCAFTELSSYASLAAHVMAANPTLQCHVHYSMRMVHVVQYLA